MTRFTLDSFAALPWDTAICLGTFDGVHAGHQALALRTARAAKEQHLVACACVFDAPPAYALRPSPDTEPLMNAEEKARRLEALGIQCVVCARFTRELALMRADAFVQGIVLGALRARYVVIGFHYRFGANAEGDAERMRALCAEHGVEVDIVPPVRDARGDVISSTGIRRMLRAGNVAGARAWLNDCGQDD